MKKLLLSFLLIVICYNVEASVGSVIDSAKKTVVETVNQLDTSSVTNKFYNDVKLGLTVLASQLKTTAEEVFIILVKQQVVNSIVYLIVLLSALIIVFNFFKACKSEEDWIDRGDPTFLGIMRVSQIVVGGFMFFIGIFQIDTIITGFVNPKYGALTEIFEIIQKY